VATTPQDGRFIAEHIAGARFLELHAAHLSNIGDAARFTSEVGTFLAT
jgi:3-oxoadipate enol-lactonase